MSEHRHGDHFRAGLDQEARNGNMPLFTERHVHALTGGVAIGFLGVAMAFARLRRQARSRW
ncbi:hypothetical protein [Paraburkholderia hiiakae]|uniref:hypothetical protein n=1 Tax=Paraburkholderia hiiakae TaxID=1081782 RepID=UPI00191A9E78|nr:hypothetical protein [Paraburkholderia hiiakae]